MDTLTARSASSPHQTGHTLVSKKNLTFPDTYGKSGEVLSTSSTGDLYWRNIPTPTLGFGLALDNGTLEVVLHDILKYVHIPLPILYKGTDRQIIVENDTLSTPQNLDKEATVQFKTLVVEDILLNGVPLVIPIIPDPIKYEVGFGMKQKENLLSVDLKVIQASIKFPEYDVKVGDGLNLRRDGRTFFIESNVPPIVKSEFLLREDSYTISYINQTESLDKVLFKVKKPGMYEVKCVVESPEQEKVHLNWIDSVGRLSIREGLSWCIMCQGSTDIKFVLDRSAYSSYNIHFVVRRV